MADFGGWLMPIEYPTGVASMAGGVLSEHHAVRENVGIFDVSHLGKISVVGTGSVDYLNAIVTNDLSGIEDGQAQYTMLCDDAGGVVDDMIAYRISADEVFLIPNAANCAKVFATLQERSPADITLKNEHHRFGVLAVQGPRSRDVISALGVDLPADLDYMAFVKRLFSGSEIIICRTGYTGELGYELVVPVAGGVARAVWQAMVELLPRFEGAVAGLGARDTLRTEMGYALHGHELSSAINPLEAGVGWAVALSKDAFIGKESLVRVKDGGVARRSIALLAQDRTIPRAGMSVKVGDEVIGEVTSGTFSPTLKKGIALALVDSAKAREEGYTIDVRGRIGEYQRVKLPFVPSHVR